MATNAQQVGIVSSTKGQVFARNAEGEMRRVQAGDPIFEGDVIIAAAGASAEISLLNGSPSLFVSDQQIVAIDEQVATTAPDATAGAVSQLGSTEAAKVVQTVAGASDLDALLDEEAPAAGLTAGDTTDGGHTFVDLVRVIEAVPGAAYEFPINPTGTPPVIEGELAPTLNEVLPPTVDVTVRDQDNITEEDTAVAVAITANAGDATDELTGLTVTLPDGWTATLDGNTYSGTFELPASGQTYTIVLMVTPPPDSDVDGQITAVASARDIVDLTLTADSLPATASVLVDAVLDAAVQVDDGNVTAPESATMQTINLGLTGTQLGVTLYGQNDGAGDANETASVTIATEGSLVLSGYEGSAVLSTGAGGYTLSGFSDLADLESAIEHLAVQVPAGFDGQVTGSIFVFFNDPATDAGEVAGNNSYEDSAAFTVTVSENDADPTVALSTSTLMIPEDGSLSLTVTATTGGGIGDELTAVTFNGLPAWATVTTLGGDPVTLVGGVYTPADGAQSVTLKVTFTPPADSSVDAGAISVTATAADSDGSNSVTTDPAPINVDVDAILDASLAMADASNSGEESATAQTISLNFAAGETSPFGQADGAGDANETGSVTVTVNTGTLSLATNGSGLTLVDNGGGSYELSGTAAQLAAAVNALQVTVPGGFDGQVTGTVSWHFEDPEADAGMPGNNLDSGSADYTVTVYDSPVNPTVALSTNSLLIQEDGSGSFTVTGTTTGNVTDKVTALTFSNLPNAVAGDWLVEISDDGGATWTEATAVDGSFTYTPASAVTSVTLTVKLTPPADSDVDVATLKGSDIGVTVTATDADGVPFVTTPPATIDVNVDAVLDQFGDVSTVAVADRFESTSGTQAINLGANLTLADTGWNNNDPDASETVGVTLTLNSALPGDAVLSSTAGTVVLQSGTTYTVTASAGHTLAEAVAGLQVTVAQGWDGTISGTIASHAYETTSGDFEETVLPGGYDNVKDDSATFSVTVKDIPISQVSATDVSADEDDIPLAGGNAGGPGDLASATSNGHLSYVLGGDALSSIELSVATTGLTLLDGTTPVNTYWDATNEVLVGYGGSDQSNVVFQIELDNVGSSGADYTLTWLQPVKHALTDDPSTGAEEIAFEDSLSFTVDISVKDTDGSEGNTSFDVLINDDSPLLNSVEPAVLFNTATGYTTGGSDVSIGADVVGAGDLTANVSGWTGAASYAASSLTSGGDTVYYSVTADKGTLYAYTDSNTTHSGYSGASGQTLIFTLTYNADGDYAIDMNGKLDGVIQTFGATYNQNIGGNQDYLLVTDAGHIYKPGDSIPASETVVITVDSSFGTVNSSQNGLAISNQWVDSSEAIYFSFSDPALGASFKIDIQGGAASEDVVWIAHGENALGETVTEIGTTNFSQGVMTEIPTTLTNITRIELSDGGTNGFRVSGSSLTDHIEESSVTTSFQVAVLDADGDKASGTLNVEFLPVVEGRFIVGSATDDETGSSALFTVPQAGVGVIGGDGGAGPDVLVGDPGGSTLQPGTVANICLVLDTSGSMTENNDGPGGSDVDRLAQLKAAVISALNNLASSGAQDVLVHLVEFNTNGNDLGSFRLTTNGVDNATALSNAIAAVNGLEADGYTNYEAGLTLANNWIESTGAGAPLADATLNKLVFVSDGEPNRAYNANGTTVGSFGADAAIQHVLGTYDRSGTSNDDTISEVARIENTNTGSLIGQAFTIEAVGISVGSTALNLLSQVEGTGGSATNVTTAEQMSQVIGELTGAVTINDAAGSDTLNGGAGDDLIFGDVLNTDALANLAGLTTQDGSGWMVFQQLEAGSSPNAAYQDWTRADTVDYLKDHQSEVAAESGRTGGHDTINAGAGNDVVYGQEGNDTISGGAGDDILSGGTGADTFVFRLADTPDGSLDTVKDFSVSDGDILRFEDVVSVDVASSGGDSTVIAHYTDGSIQTVVVENAVLATQHLENNTDNVIQING